MHTSPCSPVYRESHDVGSGCLRQIKSAISVACSVMERTGHTLLVGEDGAHSVSGRAGWVAQANDVHRQNLNVTWADWNMGTKKTVSFNIIYICTIFCLDAHPVCGVWVAMSYVHYKWKYCVSVSSRGLDTFSNWITSHCFIRGIYWTK